MKERKKYIDIAKGIAMIFVVMGHCEYINTNVYVWLYSFHMPLFFILSGITFSINNKPHFKDFLKNKFFKLVIPYLLLSIVMWPVSTIMKCVALGFDVDYFKELAGIIISDRSTGFYYTMWFIFVLLEAELFLYLLVKFIKNKSQNIKNIVYVLIGLISILIGVLLSNYTNGLIFCLDLLPYSIGFVSFGYFIKENIGMFEKIFNKKYYIIVFGLIHLTFTYLNYKACGRTDLYECTPGNYFYMIIHSVFGSLAIINLSFIINKNKILEYIGKNSLIYYAFQNTIVIPICANVLEFMFNKLRIINLEALLFSLTVITSLIMLTIVNEIIRRYLPFLLGKRE